MLVICLNPHNNHIREIILSQFRKWGNSGWVVCQGHTAVNARIVYALVYCVLDLKKQYEIENCIHWASWGGRVPGSLLQALLSPLDQCGKSPISHPAGPNSFFLGGRSVISCWGTKHRPCVSGAIVAIFARMGSYRGKEKWPKLYCWPWMQPDLKVTTPDFSFLCDSASFGLNKQVYVVFLSLLSRSREHCWGPPDTTLPVLACVILLKTHTLVRWTSLHPFHGAESED